MDKEKLVKWEPIEKIEKEMYLEGLHDDWEGFRLLLRGVEKSSGMLRITFDPAWSYRYIDEGDYLKSLGELSKYIDGAWPLYIVENSKYIEWFNEESLGMHKDDDIVHYAIYTPVDLVDVLSAFPPKVEWL